jgi:hypothetical protein
MKKLLFFILLLSPSILLLAQTEKAPYQVKSLSNDAIKLANIKTSGGNISVQGVEPANARIEVYITASNGRHNTLSKEEIQKRLDADYELNITTANGKLTAIAKAKQHIRDWKKALNISFIVYIPSNSATDLSTSGGNISLDNLSGDEKFTTSGGNLLINHVGGKINGKTSGGNIEIENSKDEIEVSTSGGNVVAKNAEGNLNLTTSGGSINLENIKGTTKAITSGGNIDGEKIEGELKAHTSGGNISLEKLSCALEASTSGGNIDVTLDKFGRYVKLNNSGGNINLQVPGQTGVDFDMSADKIQSNHLNNFSGQLKENEIVGKLNGGGIPVSVSASSGRIHLTVK